MIEGSLEVKLPTIWRDEKLHAAVARSSSSSQNVQTTCILEHFWRFGSRKGVRQMR